MDVWAAAHVLFDLFVGWSRTLHGNSLSGLRPAPLEKTRGFRVLVYQSSGGRPMVLTRGCSQCRTPQRWRCSRREHPELWASRLPNHLRGFSPRFINTSEVRVEGPSTDSEV